MDESGTSGRGGTEPSPFGWFSLRENSGARRLGHEADFENGECDSQKNEAGRKDICVDWHCFYGHSSHITFKATRSISPTFFVQPSKWSDEARGGPITAARFYKLRFVTRVVYTN